MKIGADVIGRWLSGVEAIEQGIARASTAGPDRAEAEALDLQGDLDELKSGMREAMLDAQRAEARATS